MEKAEKKRVTFKVDEDLYFEYKKALIDARTTPTADFIRHMNKTVDDAKQEREGKNAQRT